MPFGSNPKAYLLLLGREAFAAHQGKLPVRRIRLPSAEPPDWWSDYLLEEWKRRNRMGQVPRDTRTRCQRVEDESKAIAWRCAEADPHTVAAAPHRIWGS